jgi:hypothetical protein
MWRLMMVYEQKVTLTIRYNPEEVDSPEFWNYPLLLDVEQNDVTVEEVGPITVVDHERS